MKQITAPIAPGEIVRHTAGNGHYLIAVANDTTAAGPLYRVTADHTGMTRIGIYDLHRSFADEKLARSWARQICQLFNRGLKDFQVVAEMHKRVASVLADAAATVDLDAKRQAAIHRLQHDLVGQYANPNTTEAAQAITDLQRRIAALKTQDETADEEHQLREATQPRSVTRNNTTRFTDRPTVTGGATQTNLFGQVA